MSGLEELLRAAPQVLEPETDCFICLDGYSGGGEDGRCIELPCGHTGHPICLRQLLLTTGKCGLCSRFYLVQTGTMGPGTMTVTNSPAALPGHEGCGTITIHYAMSGGVQGSEHPSPGTPFSGTSRVAYLPDSPDGREALRLLRIAFDRRLTFTVGTSLTTGASNTTVWNGIHHKTSPHGGPTSFGYPDDSYLQRLFAELAAKGITRAST